MAGTEDAAKMHNTNSSKIICGNDTGCLYRIIVLTKYDMFAVEMRTRTHRDKELGRVCIRAPVGHDKQAKCI
jgi:hypothetical protein